MRRPLEAPQEVLPAEGAEESPGVVADGGVEEAAPLNRAAPGGRMIFAHRLSPQGVEFLPDGLPGPPASRGEGSVRAAPGTPVLGSSSDPRDG